MRKIVVTSSVHTWDSKLERSETAGKAGMSDLGIREVLV